MANLLEALQPKMEDTTSQLSTLLRAKSGKAVAGPSTALSTQQEQAALAQTAQEMQPVRTAAQTQTAAQEQQAREVAQRAEQQQTEIAQGRQANELQMRFKTNQLLQELEQGKGKIDTARYQATMEQLGQNLRLSTKVYTDTLQREGDLALLGDKLQFEQQLQRSIFQDAQNLLEKQLKNKSILNAQDREYELSLERMGLNDALNLLRAELKGEKEAMAAKGVGTIITTGIGALGKYLDSPKTPSATEDWLGGNKQLDNTPPGTLEA